MARYKVLKSVAHNVGHSFTSTLNFCGEDYVMGHLLRRAMTSGQSRLEVDLLSGVGEPAQLCEGPVAAAAMAYAGVFDHLLVTQGSSRALVAAAQLSIEFDLSRSRTVAMFPQLQENPYVCTVTIVDDRGKRWQAQISGWWYPEAGETIDVDTLSRL